MIGWVLFIYTNQYNTIRTCTLTSFNLLSARIFPVLVIVVTNIVQFFTTIGLNYEHFGDHQFYPSVEFTLHQMTVDLFNSVVKSCKSDIALKANISGKTIVFAGTLHSGIFFFYGYFFSLKLHEQCRSRSSVNFLSD